MQPAAGGGAIGFVLDMHIKLGLTTPAGDMSFNGLHQERFDGEHHSDEGQSIGQDAR